MSLWPPESLKIFAEDFWSNCGHDVNSVEATGLKGMSMSGKFNYSLCHWKCDIALSRPVATAVLHDHFTRDSNGCLALLNTKLSSFLWQQF